MWDTAPPFLCFLSFLHTMPFSYHALFAHGLHTSRCFLHYTAFCFTPPFFCHCILWLPTIFSPSSIYSSCLSPLSLISYIPAMKFLPTIYILIREDISFPCTPLLYSCYAFACALQKIPLCGGVDTHILFLQHFHTPFPGSACSLVFVYVHTHTQHLALCTLQDRTLFIFISFLFCTFYFTGLPHTTTPTTPFPAATCTCLCSLPPPFADRMILSLLSPLSLSSL